MRRTDHTLNDTDPTAQKIWDAVARSPLHTLWDFQGASAKLVWKRTFQAMISDNLLSRAAEMGYYFLFAIFPLPWYAASSLLGLVARQSVEHLPGKLLHYLALVVPGFGVQDGDRYVQPDGGVSATDGQGDAGAGGGVVVGVGGICGDPGRHEHGL